MLSNKINKKAVFVLGSTVVFSIFIFALLLEIQRKLNQSKMESCAIAATNSSLPASRFIDINTGKDLYQNVRDGKVLLVLLATECGSCQKEVQIISENPALLNQKVKIFGIVKENKIKVQEFVQKFNLGFPVLIDEQEKLFNQLQIKCTPTNLLIEDGVIKNVLVGSPTNTETLIEDLNSF